MTDGLTRPAISPLLLDGGPRRRLYDAGSIEAAVLVVRGERDFWSRPEDAQALAHDAVHAARLEVLTLPGADHFLHLETADHGRRAFLDAVEQFLVPRQ